MTTKELIKGILLIVSLLVQLVVLYLAIFTELSTSLMLLTVLFIFIPSIFLLD